MSIDIDGSIGGGSVLRVAVPLALSLDREIRVHNIRASRPKPGLRLQHLLGLQLMEKLSGYSLVGGQVGSTEISFQKAENPKTSNLSIKSTTAASISLVLQILSNYAFAKGANSEHFELELDFVGGGTHVAWSPSYDYVKEVTRPIFSLFGQDISYQVEKFGYYPKGGAKGRIRITQKPFDEQPIQLSIGKGDAIVRVISRASQHLKNANVAKRQLESLKTQVKVDLERVYYDDTASAGSSCHATIVREENHPVLGLSMLGRKGLASEKIGKNLGKEIQSQLTVPWAVDEFMADQLIVPLALASSRSSFSFGEMTDHIQTNLQIIEQVLGKMLQVSRIGGNIRYYLVQKT